MSLKNSINIWVDMALGALKVVTSAKQVTSNFQDMDNYITGVIFNTLTDTTVANSTNETSLIGAGLGSRTLDANFLAQAKSVQIEAWGYYSATSTPTLRIRNKLGSSTIEDTTAFTIANATNGAWKMTTIIDCRTAGTSGTVMAQSDFVYNSTLGTSSRISTANTAVSVIDTTTTQLIDMTEQWGTAAAGNTITCTNYKVRIEL